MTPSRISMVIAAGALVLVGLLAAALFSPSEKDDPPADTTAKDPEIEILSPAARQVQDYPVLPPPPAATPPAPARTENPAPAPVERPAPKPSDKPAPRVIDYTIKPRDMISKLAARNGVTTADIYALNPGLNDATASKIRAGTVIKLPTGPGATEETAAPFAAPGTVKTESKYFARREITAKAGDTAASLAVENYGGSLAPIAEIVRANSHMPKGFRCTGGEQLILPAWGAAPADTRVENTGRVEPAGPTASRDSIIPPRR